MEEHIASNTTPALAITSNESSTSSQDDKPTLLNITAPDSTSTSPVSTSTVSISTSEATQKEVVAQSARERLRQLEYTFRPTTVPQSPMKNPQVEQAALFTAEKNAPAIPDLMSEAEAAPSDPLIFLSDAKSDGSSDDSSKTSIISITISDASSAAAAAAAAALDKHASLRQHDYLTRQPSKGIVSPKLSAEQTQATAPLPLPPSRVDLSPQQATEKKVLPIMSTPRSTIESPIMVQQVSEQVKKNMESTLSERQDNAPPPPLLPVHKQPPLSPSAAATLMLPPHIRRSAPSRDGTLIAPGPPPAKFDVLEPIPLKRRGSKSKGSSKRDNKGKPAAPNELMKDVKGRAPPKPQEPLTNTNTNTNTNTSPSRKENVEEETPAPPPKPEPIDPLIQERKDGAFLAMFTKQTYESSTPALQRMRNSTNSTPTYLDLQKDSQRSDEDDEQLCCHSLMAAKLPTNTREAPKPEAPQQLPTTKRLADILKSPSSSVLPNKGVPEQGKSGSTEAYNSLASSFVDKAMDMDKDEHIDAKEIKQLSSSSPPKKKQADIMDMDDDDSGANVQQSSPTKPPATLNFEDDYYHDDYDMENIKQAGIFTSSTNQLEKPNLQQLQWSSYSMPKKASPAVVPESQGSFDSTGQNSYLFEAGDDNEAPLFTLASTSVSQANDPKNKSIHFQPDREEPQLANNDLKTSMNFDSNENDREESRSSIDSGIFASDTAVDPTKSIHFVPNQEDDARSPIESERAQFAGYDDEHEKTPKKNSKSKLEAKQRNNKGVHFDPEDDEAEALKNKESKPPQSTSFNATELALAAYEDPSSDTDSGDSLGSPIAQCGTLLSSRHANENETRSVEIDVGDFDDEIRRGVREQDDPVQEPKYPKSADVVLPVVLRMPNTGFGIAMGLAGNSIMWKMAGSALFITDRIDTDLPNQIMWFSAFIVGIVIFLTYVYKAVYSFDIVVMEYKDPVRVHFMNAPHLVLIMVAMGIPRDVDVSETALQIIFAVGLLAQTCLTQFIYEKWMFSQNSNITNGCPQFLLSVVGWFLLSGLGQQANIDDSWGIAIPSFCFGVGVIFYVMVVISVFNTLHKNRNQRGSPGLTLLMAPPAIAVVAIYGFDGNPSGSSVVAEMFLGWCFIVLLLIFKMGPRIAECPKSFGAYWAYVFPLSALATACIRYALIRDSTTADIVAVVFMGVAIVALWVVFVRMVVHIVLCFQGKGRWEDPLLGIHPNKVARISLGLRESPSEIGLDPEVQSETS